jgi:deferrochelatase/peroxidase EfeB
MVGRRIEDGKPLMSLLDSRIPGVGVESNPVKRILDIERNQFSFDSDPNGQVCPLGAHIRRANPRNPDLPGNVRGGVSHLLHMLGFGYRTFGDDYIASTRFHRLLRRGREYGPALPPEEALAPPPPGDPERGLHFIGINANIERQFEFIQNAWIMRTKFNGMTEESDPLLGNREPVPGCPFTNAFSLPQRGSPKGLVMDVPQFVTVRGGAYFFLPGLRALRYFSQAGH